MAKILIIEDDPYLGSLLVRNLKAEGYYVTLTADGRSGLETAMSGSANLIVLDLMLPQVDGLHILKAIRREMINTPVIILTARGEETERIEGFKAGCDDYVTKPFSLMELIARIRATLKRSGHREIPSVINSAGIVIDPDSRSVTFNNNKMVLSPLEFDLLYTLASHPNQALSRNYLLDEVWGEDSAVSNRTVDTHVSFLRKKIENNPDDPERIVTVFRLGYMWKV
ncbi:MAG: response regulator transcription factor [Calditrichaeota bacterium]|nr:response regulator transcription factor [Calditrichota bacterium]